MNHNISLYNQSQANLDQVICHQLSQIIDTHLPQAESKIWHAHPVWFLDGNPTVGYNKLKAGIRLMFWSGADFDEPELKPGTGKFKDASKLYTCVDEINQDDLIHWLEKPTRIQWDYKNLIKRKGKLVRLKG